MILFLDTVSISPVFVLMNNSKVIYSIQILNNKSNKISDNILPAFLTLQKKLKNDQKIKKLIVLRGPGSYTSLRIGIGFMYGLSYANNIPLIGVDCVKLLEIGLNFKQKKESIIFISSLNNQNFISYYCYKDDNYLIKKIDKLDNFVSINTKINQYKNIFSNEKILINDNLFTTQKFFYKNFTEVIMSNIDSILKLKKSDYISPIYISENKLLN